MFLMKFIKSFRFATKGIVYAFKHEANFRLQCFIGFVALCVGSVLPLKPWEFLLIVLMTILVLVLELFNTALELFADLLLPRLHHHVGAVKDIMAGAVLLTAFAAFVVGIVVLGPHLVALVK